MNGGEAREEKREGCQGQHTVLGRAHRENCGKQKRRGCLENEESKADKASRKHKTMVGYRDKYKISA